jgi:hypothetical protein
VQAAHPNETSRLQLLGDHVKCETCYLDPSRSVPLLLVEYMAVCVRYFRCTVILESYFAP